MDISQFFKTIAIVILSYAMIVFFLQYTTNKRVARIGSVNILPDVDHLISESMIDQNLLSVIENRMISMGYFNSGVKVIYMTTDQLSNSVVKGAVAGASSALKEMYINIGWILKSNSELDNLLRHLFLLTTISHEEGHLSMILSRRD